MNKQSIVLVCCLLALGGRSARAQTTAYLDYVNSGAGTGSNPFFRLQNTGTTPAASFTSANNAYTLSLANNGTNGSGLSSIVTSTAIYAESTTLYAAYLRNTTTTGAPAVRIEGRCPTGPMCSGAEVTSDKGHGLIATAATSGGVSGDGVVATGTRFGVRALGPTASFYAEPTNSSSHGLQIVNNLQTAASGIEVYSENSVAARFVNGGFGSPVSHVSAVYVSNNNNAPALDVSSGAGFGVSATSSFSSGVAGFASASYAAGLRGEGNGGNWNFGVWGYSANGIGVYGQGVYGGYFSGNVHVQGTLSKAGGSFKIDHPQDPAGKFLVHSFVESPDMMNVYNGLVEADVNGEAWVELPQYYSALNISPRYQLTSVGGPAAPYVKTEIQGNRFQIGGSRQGLKISWQVTGIRNDHWARANRIVPEVVKSPVERGRYLTPELFGAPSTQRINPNDVANLR